MAEEMGDATAVVEELAGYCVVRELTGGRSYLCELPGGRRVVLKTLDGDCVQDRGLHPLIKDRLSRVRELATPAVANLRAVEREGEACYLVWDYVEGRPLEEWFAGGVSSAAAKGVARELIQAVESMHARGIVHGAIHGGNVIVGDDGSVRLTHVSPLLYDDPEEDVKDVVGLLGELLGEGFDVAGARGMSLRELSRKVAGVGEEEGARESVAVVKEDRRLRRRALLGAAAGVLMAVGIVGAVRKVAHRQEQRPLETGGKNAVHAAPSDPRV